MDNRPSPAEAVKRSKEPYSILNVSGPFREPREPSLSYDYSVHRPSWATPQAVRVKVSIEQELDYLKRKVLAIEGGTPGQQLMVNRILSKWVADAKLAIADGEGLFSQRLDVMIDPFVGPLSHLFPLLSAKMEEARESLRQEIRDKVKL
jgi:hypothetical protein